MKGILNCFRILYIHMIKTVTLDQINLRGWTFHIIILRVTCSHVTEISRRGQTSYATVKATVHLHL